MKKFLFISLMLISLISNPFAMGYQEVNDEFKLLNIESSLEIYTNGEEQLYRLESPHGHWFNPQGWGHCEKIIVDLRRFYVDLWAIDYIPVYFGVKYQTWAYMPYADSVQVVGQEIGLKIPLFVKNLAVRLAVIPESWSGSQVTSLEYSLIGQFIANHSNYYLLNFNLTWHENSFLSLRRYIETENISWTSSKEINFDLTIDTRAFNNYIYFGYRLNHKWNDDPTQPPLQYTFTKHSLFLGNSSEISKDLFLIFEGSFEWKDLTRIGRVNAILSYKTNLGGN